MITNEEASILKKQVIEQLKNFPEDKKKVIEERILSMNNQELEDFIKQNQEQPQEKQNQCIFCEITQGKVKSNIIAEEKEVIATLEINPISKGHTLVIPKKHLETTKIPKQAFSLAKKIANKIKSKFKPIEIKITTSTIMGHALIEIIPFYKDTDPSKRQRAEEKDLISVQQLLFIIKQEKRKIIKKQEPITKNNSPDLPCVKQRIP